MDIWDVMVVVGVALIAVGLWYVWPPAIAFWVGAVLLIAGGLGARNGGTGDA